MDRHELTDKQWEALELCLPPLNTGRGRKMHDRRRIINGILWSLKTGAPWRDLPEKYGKSKGGWTTKIVLVCENNLLPMTSLVRGGQACANPLVLPAVDQVAIRTSAGRIRKRSKKVAGDKGCSSKDNRNGLRRRGVRPVIACKSNEKGASRPFDKETYKKRNTIERLFCHLKECRRVATRYEKLAVRYHAIVKIACIRYLLTKL